MQPLSLMSRRFVFLIWLVAVCEIPQTGISQTDDLSLGNDPSVTVPNAIPLRIRVINDGSPVPEADVQVWGDPSHPTLINPVKTDMGGEIFVDVSNLRTSTFSITARVENRLAGYSDVLGHNYDLGRTCEIKIEPTKQLTAFVIDYDTGNPIESCLIQVWLNGSQGVWVDPRINLVTKADGKIQIDGLIAGMNARIKATCEGYHNFAGPAPSVDYGLRQRNRVRAG